MTAKEWLKAEYFDFESGDWFHYDIHEAMEAYAKQVIAERMPTEEEIQKHIETTRFMDGTPSMDEQTFYEGAKWFRSRMEEKK
jgi:hypothetical protein